MCLKDGVKNIVVAYAQYKTHLDDVKNAEEIAKQQKVLSARKKKKWQRRKKLPQQPNGLRCRSSMLNSLK